MKRPRPAADPLETAVASGLALGRLAIGAGIWLAPGLSARVLGFGSLDSSALALGRVAATRDLVLGSFGLGALRDRPALRRTAVAGVAADAGDALAFGLLLGAGGDVRAAAVRGLAAALPAAVAGHWLSRRLAA